MHVSGSSHGGECHQGIMKKSWFIPRCYGEVQILVGAKIKKKVRLLGIKVRLKKEQKGKPTVSSNYSNSTPLTLRNLDKAEWEGVCVTYK